MADTLRIKRRTSGSPGAPASLANAELAYNEVDHTLYYGEGTGGAGGSATTVVPIGGSGLGSNAVPNMDGVGAAGTATLMARGDHVHPSDTSRAPINSPTFTGVPAAPTPANGTATTQIATTQFVLATRLDQLNAPNFDVLWGNHRIINLLDPANPQDAATKAYVDNAAQGVSAKAPVVAATTGNITLSGTQTIDGVALIAGNRALVKNQTSNVDNGIYVVAAGAWARSGDADAWGELVSGYVFVEQGTTQADTGWLCTVDPGGIVGGNPVTWVQFSAAGQITAGNGLTKAGNVISAVGTTNRIAVGASIDIAATYVGQTSITTLGVIGTGTWNGTPVTVAFGGSGATTLTGYLKGNGASPFTASATIPTTDITGLGTMATQNASAVAITGGTIDGVTLDGGTF